MGCAVAFVDIWLTEWGEKAPILNIFLYRSENWGPDLTVFFIFIENSLKGSIATKLYIKRWD